VFKFMGDHLTKKLEAVLANAMRPATDEVYCRLGKLWS
jgi:hypothetical protein